MPSSPRSSTGTEYSCEWRECGVQCQTRKDLLNHLLRAHAVQRNVKNGKLVCRWGDCTTRPKYCNGKNMLTTDHMRTHAQYRAFTCKDCEKTFLSEKSYNQHVRRATCSSNMTESDNDQDVESDDGHTRSPEARTSSRDTSLNPTPSMKSQDEEDELDDDSFPCLWGTCKHAALDPNSLLEHIKSKHFERMRGNDPQMCQWLSCNRFISAFNRMEVHVRAAHLPHWFMPFACSECDVHFALHSQLAQHVKRVHGFQLDSQSPRTLKRKLEADGPVSSAVVPKKPRLPSDATPSTPTKKANNPQSISPIQAGSSPIIDISHLKVVIEAQVDSLIQDALTRKLGL